MKYKIGDTVTIRNDLVNSVNSIYFMDNKMYSDDCTDEMVDQGGKQFTILNAFSQGYELENIGYNWTDEMFVDKR